MSDYRTMFDKEHIGAWDLAGRDVVVEIAAVKAGKVGHGNKASKKPILSFRGKSKTMTCNITNASIIAQLYGNDTRKWVGKRVTLYPTLTSFGGKEVDCIRIRPQAPGANTKAREEDFEQPDPEERERMLAKQDEATGRPLRSDADRQALIDAGEDPDA